MKVEEGPAAPRIVAVADIVTAQVTGDGSEVQFEVRLGAPVDDDRPAGTLGLRWDVIEAGEFTWILTADLGSRPFAALVSQRTDYGSSTLDKTLPGDIEVQDATVTVTLRSKRVPSWPREFDWTVTSTLDADRNDPTSPVAEDRAPAGGNGHFAP